MTLVVSKPLASVIQTKSKNRQNQARGFSHLVALVVYVQQLRPSEVEAVAVGDTRTNQMTDNG